MVALFSSGPQVENTSNNVIKKPSSKFEAGDVVWSRMEGYPWWPAVVCNHPVDKKCQRKNLIHVQFFDDPPSRGWIKEKYVIFNRQ